MAGMSFCPKCGGLLVPSADKKKFVCSCGYQSRSDARLTLKEKSACEKAEKVKEEFNETLAKAKEECQKCGHKEAFTWSAQTRAADEAETVFYRCCKCNHTWREYA